MLYPFDMKAARGERVVIVDDHPVVVEGLAHLLEKEDGLTVICRTESPAEALACASRCRPTLFLVDLALGGHSGLDLVKELALRHPKLPVLVVSMLDEEIYAERAVRAGARGYVMKDEAPEKLIDAVRTIAAGGMYVSEAVSRRILLRMCATQRDHASAVDTLSDRELQVLEFIGRGEGTKQIAATLGLSVKTIDTYRDHLKHKLGIADVNHLVRFAVKWLDAVDGSRAALGRGPSDQVIE